MPNDLQKIAALLQEATKLLEGLIPKLLIPTGKTSREELEKLGWVRVDENGIRYYEVREDGVVLKVIRLSDKTGMVVL